MKAFTQMLKYIWPQWPRLVVVVFSALVIAMLLSLSFMTIIPLLKVMMGEEGLHGWVNRKAAESYYGLQFYVPATTELTEETSLRTQLLVLDVREDSLADKAGIRRRDHITDVNGVQAQEGSNASYTRLLQELAFARSDTVSVTLSREQDNGLLRVPVTMATPDNEQYVASLGWGATRRLNWQVWTTAARIGERFVEVAVNHLREDVFRHMTRMPIGIFADERPSDLISRIVRDTVTMGSAFRVLLGKALREPLNAVIMLFAAFFINWQLALVFLCGAPPVVVLLGSFGRKMKKATRQSLMASSRMLAKLQETVVGLRVIKVYDREEHELQSFQDINNRLLKQLLRISRVDAATQPVLEVMGMIVGAGALILGMVWVTEGKVEGSEFLLLLGLLGAAAEAVRKTSDIWTRIQQANAAAERIFDVLQQPTEMEKPNAGLLPPVRDAIEFRDVTFSYPGAQRRTLDNINLLVKAGHNVAIVGANGSGKTTLANLLPRFYDPASGHVLIDGQDIRDVTLRSLRSQIGMVTQQVISFNDTIAANIGYGRHDATQDEIVAAAQRAYAHEFITRLPKGYDAVIGEQGVGLSGGQLQRIVIARAIIKNPAILIFDEATSQIDAESEAKIHEAIQEIMRGRTTFIIAHRFSTVVAADVIVVMNDGRIIAQGRHEELIRTCSVYQALYETQLA
jgi:subfamily B ATP-binding cassette protein MsbA